MILNAGTITLDQNSGTLPDMSGALKNWFRPMTFRKITKVVTAYQVQETAVVISTQGVFQPLTGKQLLIKPEGQRAWSWWQLHAETDLVLDVDEIVEHNGEKYRVMSQKDYGLYGYVEYELVKDWTGSDPVEAP